MTNFNLIFKYQKIYCSRCVLIRMTTCNEGQYFLVIASFPQGKADSVEHGVPPGVKISPFLPKGSIMTFKDDSQIRTHPTKLLITKVSQKSK